MSTIDLDKMKPAATADVKGKRVLVRADLNVPVKEGKVTDATRIARFLPTVKDLAVRGAKVIVLSHFGRPDGERVAKMSLRPIADAMAALSGTPVRFGDDCIGDAARKAIDAMQPGDIAVLENTRFHAGEEANDPDFTRALAALGDLYVNDAFSCAHRAHASTEGLAHHLPAFAGQQMMAEITALRGALENPERPVMAIVGGSKVSTKIPVLTNLAKKVQHLVIGGGMANTFLLADGTKIGRSLAEPDFIPTVGEIKASAKAAGCRIHLPVDAALAKKLEAGAESRICALDGVAGDEMILDIGPKSIDAIRVTLRACRTLLWNGPVGAFEIAPFGEGTFAIAREAAELTKAGRLVSVAGGGDTVAALNMAGVPDDLTYVSTAGGAFLEWLEGRELPGVAALTR
ncbi:MAG: phosphoglycerate kinase [Hyphomicrobiaceae bacterium]